MTTDDIASHPSSNPVYSSSETTNRNVAEPAKPSQIPQGSLPILIALSTSHMLNDIMQSLLPAMYPVFKESYSLSPFQIGLITFAFQTTASLLQPIVGIATDRKPRPYALAFGMGCTLVGLILLSQADSFGSILVAAATVGIGSSIFHPEASRVARLASGGKFGLAQSLFQVGGNSGSALGPLLAAYFVVPRGQSSIAWFTLAALFGVVVLSAVGTWYSGRLQFSKSNPRRATVAKSHTMSNLHVAVIIGILLLLVFSKHFYMVSLTNFYTFYLMKRFDVTVQTAQVCLFVFLAAYAAGTLGGGPVGDRFGFRTVIWFSILGALPFTLILPYANFFWTVVLTVPIGLIMASAFSAIIVYAQELVPSRVGLIAGLFFGFAFGVAGVGAASLGKLWELTSIEFVYSVCSLLPIVGLLTVFLPKLK